MSLIDVRKILLLKWQSHNLRIQPSLYHMTEQRPELEDNGHCPQAQGRGEKRILRQYHNDRPSMQDFKQVLSVLSNTIRMKHIVKLVVAVSDIARRQTS